MADDLGTLRAAINADTKGWTKGFSSAEQTLTGFGKKVPKLIKPISLALVGMGATVVGTLGIAVGKFVSFEKAMKNVAAVSGATGDSFDSLSAFALEMGSTTAFTAREAAEGMYFLASAGLDVEEQMQATSAVLDLAAATQSDMSQSAQAVVNTLSGFTLQADQSRRVADVFAESISSSQATLEKLRVSLPITSAAFSDMKWSVEDNVAALSLLYDKGGRAETAATGLRMAIKTLLDVTPEGAQALADMGLTMEDVSPLTNTLAEIVGNLEQANFDTTDSIKIFGKENDAMSKLVSQGSEKLIEFEKSLRDAAGAAQKMRDIQLDSLSGDFTLFKSAVEGAAIGLGMTLAPALRKTTKEITSAVSWFNKLSDTEKKMIGWGTATTGGLLTVAGGLGLVVAKIPDMMKGIKMLPKMTGPIAIVTAGVLLNAAAWSKAYKHYKMWRDGIITAEEDIKGWQKATKNQREALNLLNQSMKDAKTHGYDPLTWTLSELNVDFNKLNKLLGGHTRLAMNAGVLHDTLSKSIGETDKKIGKITETTGEATESTGEANDATKDLNGTMGDLNKTLGGTETEWKNISKAFGEYTSITGEGYRLTKLRAIDYWQTVKKGGLETAEAERAVTNTISNLWEEWYKEAAWLDKATTTGHKGELKERDVIDAEYMKKRTAYREKEFDEHKAIRIKEKGMIKEFFDWEVLSAHERAEKELAIRIAEQARVEALDEHMWELKQANAIEDLKMTTFYAERGCEEKISVANKEAKQREDLSATFLRSAKKNLEDEIGTREEIYNNFLPFFEKYNLDLTSLDKWRADQMLKTEKKLTADKVEEINRYSSAFEERLMNDTKMAADYWGAVDLVTGKFDEQKYLESRKGAGGYIYQGLDPDYVKRLNYPLSQSVPSFDSGAAAPSPSQPVTRAPEYESYTGSAVPAQAAPTIIINIENVNGGDEGALNDLAEDIARRIQAQNISI